MKKPLFLPLLFLSFAHAETLECKFVEVINGDSFTCFAEQGKQIKARLYHVKAPELYQPYGKKAKESLTHMMAWDPQISVIPRSKN